VLQFASNNNDGFVGRQDHAVDGMDDAIACRDVGGGDGGGAVAAVCEHETAASGVDLEVAASQRHDGAARRHLRALDLRAQHVVGQHGTQQRLVGFGQQS
jgi:hypothetical protein